MLFRQPVKGYMFDEQVFHSWPQVLGGALLFAGLFTCVALLSELLFDGGLRLTRRVVGFGLAAFTGYIVMALLVRQDGPPNERA